MSNEKKYTEVDHLDEDQYLLEDFWNSGSEDSKKFRNMRKQHWYCMSFLSPEGVRNCSVRGVKVSAGFETQQDANDFANILRQHNKYFNVFVGEGGKWLPWDPEDDQVEKDPIYQEKELNELAKAYKEQQEKAAEVHRERQTDAVNSANNNNVSSKFNDPRSQNKKEELKKKLEERKRKQMEQNNGDNKEQLLQTTSQKYEQIKDDVKKTEDRMQEIIDLQKEFNK
jgi:hypothetical protein